MFRVHLNTSLNTEGGGGGEIKIEEFRVHLNSEHLKGHVITKLNSKTVPVIPSLDTSCISFSSFSLPDSFCRIFFLYLLRLLCPFLSCCHQTTSNPRKIKNKRVLCPSEHLIKSRTSRRATQKYHISMAKPDQWSPQLCISMAVRVSV